MNVRGDSLSTPRRGRDDSGGARPQWLALAAALVFLGLAIAAFLFLPAASLRRIEDSLTRRSPTGVSPQ